MLFPGEDNFSYTQHFLDACNPLSRVEALGAFPIHFEGVFTECPFTSLFKQRIQFYSHFVMFMHTGHSYFTVENLEPREQFSKIVFLGEARSHI